MGAKKNTAVLLEPVPVLMLCGCTIYYRVAPPIEGDYVMCLTHGPTWVVKQSRRRNVGRIVRNTVRHD